MIPIHKLIGPANVGPDVSKWAVASAAPALTLGQRYRKPIKDSPDLQRILALPRREPPNEEQSQQLIEAMTAHYRRENKHCRCHTMDRDCLDTLNRVQAWGLYEMQYTKGLIGSITVGGGKTLLGLLAPLALGLKPGEIALMVCPPGNVGEVVAEYKLASQHFRMPSITTHGRINFTCPQKNAPALHVLPYSLLQRPEYESWVRNVKPVAVIADEVDKLRDPSKSATSARIVREYDEDPEKFFCGWTGSLTDKTIEDYRHLMQMSFGISSPCPIDKYIAKDWGRALNPGENLAPAGALLQLCRPGEPVRSGYRRRLSETAGVIFTTKASIDTPVIITTRKAPPIPTVVQEALDECRMMRRPDGEEFVTPMQMAACAKEIACGFHYIWWYPRGEPKSLVDEWFEARKKWHCELRGELEGRLQGKDSDKLCKDAALRFMGRLACKHCQPVTQFLCQHCKGTGKDTVGPAWKSTHLERWLQVEDLVKPEQMAIRLHDYLAIDAAEWGQKNTGIIWYSHAEFGKWVSEVSGFTRHTGGPNARELILAEDGSRTIIASMKSHGRGRDGLQFSFFKQLVTSCPSSADIQEQLLGRLARPGTKWPEIFAEYYQHTKELRASMATSIKRAAYFNETLGSSQRIL